MMNNTKLTLDIVESYGFKREISKPDWDDVMNTYTLPNGLSVSFLTVCNNRPTSFDGLEGLDGWVYIRTKEELDILLSKTFREICEDIASKEKKFKFEEYYEE